MTVPIILIRNSHLVNALLCEIEEETATETKYNFLDLSTSSFLEKNLRLLMDSVDDLSQETNKFFNYQRSLAKQQQAKQQYLQKRQQESKMRVDRGEAPLPEEDINKLFKPLQMPPRLDSLLLSGQITEYASQMKEFASQTFGKLFVVDSLQDYYQTVLRLIRLIAAIILTECLCELIIQLRRQRPMPR